MDQGICQQVSKTANCVQKVSRRVKKLEKKVCDPPLSLYVELANSITGSGIDAIIIYDTVIKDTNNIYDIGTGIVTLPDDSREYILTLSTKITIEGDQTGPYSLTTGIVSNGLTTFEITNVEISDNISIEVKTRTLNYTQIIQPGVNSFPNSFTINVSAQTLAGTSNEFTVLGTTEAPITSFLQIQSL
jgi:hypothetical protein